MSDRVKHTALVLGPAPLWPVANAKCLRGWVEQGVRVVYSREDAYSDPRSPSPDSHILIVIGGGPDGSDRGSVLYAPTESDRDAVRVFFSQIPGSVRWDLKGDIMAFTDGACTANGKKGAAAGYGVVVRGGHCPAELCGPVPPCEMELVTAAAAAAAASPCVGASPPQLIPKSAPAAPSNNRAELLGIIHCMLWLLRHSAAGRIRIYSDSKICVMTLLSWLPNRLAKGTERELKNFDLVWASWQLLGQLRELADSVDLVHVRAHQTRPPATDPGYPIWEGNSRADALAGQGITAV